LIAGDEKDYNRKKLTAVYFVVFEKDESVSSEGKILI
jgi:hypothetical protein